MLHGRRVELLLRSRLWRLRAHYTVRSGSVFTRWISNHTRCQLRKAIITALRSFCCSSGKDRKNHGTASGSTQTAKHGMRITCVCSRSVCARSQQAAQLHKRTNSLFCSRYQVCNLLFLPRPVLHAAQPALSCMLLCLRLVAGKPGLYVKKTDCKLWQMLGRMWMSRLGCRKHRQPADCGLRYHPLTL